MLKSFKNRAMINGLKSKILGDNGDRFLTVTVQLCVKIKLQLN